MEDDAKQLIHAKIVGLARGLGSNAGSLRYDQEIPATGFLDSGAIIELILWLESEYGITIPQEELSLANFGTIDAITGYLRRAGVSL